MMVFVCRPDQRCVELEYPQLLALAERLVDDPRWRGARPIIARGCPVGVDGYCVGRRIRFARVAPACVVPHELAHLRSGEVGHGPRWAAAYVELARWLGAEV